MNQSELMNALQSKMEAQNAELRALIQSSLESHTDSIHTALHNHLLEVDSKVANLNPKTQPQSHGSSGAAAHTLKLSVPRFDGSNPTDWLFQIESFFNFHETP